MGRFVTNALFRTLGRLVLITIAGYVLGLGVQALLTWYSPEPERALFWACFGWGVSLVDGALIAFGYQWVRDSR